ncbi:hypothetical protein [Nonomuraea turcica]|uniref:hypothetical protein n=1 Tax=Nonomuraea sp. G32 TaxID=3067274 RepID=UPI00273C9E0E|nr:hypothetical protein [Nonomuraea sp. G32]MDP4511648.1 hypothetical protein [Nonomuraea sp. G32]
MNIRNDEERLGQTTDIPPPRPAPVLDHDTPPATTSDKLVFDPAAEPAPPQLGVHHRVQVAGAVARGQPDRAPQGERDVRETWHTPFSAARASAEEVRTCVAPRSKRSVL